MPHKVGLSNGSKRKGRAVKLECNEGGRGIQKVPACVEVLGFHSEHIRQLMNNFM